MQKIVYNYNNKLHYLKKMPYETEEEAFKRLFFIIKNDLSLNNVEHINLSKKRAFEEKGLTFEEV